MPSWWSKTDDDSREVERVLREEFPRTDAYRYNGASVRVRVIDERFRGRPIEERDGLVEPYIHRLPIEIQADIMNLLTFAPGETDDSIHRMFWNQEFENPDLSD